MVAKVISGQNIEGALYYNENKVEEGIAECIHASGFGAAHGQLSFSNKLLRFQKLVKLKPNVKTNTLHISLNFDPSEKLGQEKLARISQGYMARIGFGAQPFLVYRHDDAGHPHIHILTTIITPDAKRIDIHNIGRNQSELARKEIEIEFGLLKAESRNLSQGQLIKPADLRKVIYGKAQTKRSISNVVRSVVRSYKFTSLPELNAVLRQFNVIADRGEPDSHMFKKGGLTYSLVDQLGIRVGVPIKASSIYTSPTLKFLTSQFGLNEAVRQPHRDKLKALVSLELRTSSSPDQFIGKLKSRNVNAVVRQNKDGLVYGITFVDNNSCTVFNGSDLGKDFTAKRIFENLSSKGPTAPKVYSDLILPEPETVSIHNPLQDLIHAQQFDFSGPSRKRKRRRKRKPKF